MTVRRRLLSRIAIAATAAGLTGLGLVYGVERLWLRSWAQSNRYNDGPANGPGWLDFETDGLTQPPTFSPTEAEVAEAVADDEAVIGVVVNQETRAYPVSALSDRSRHVVNDVVAGVPVTYCDLDDRARGFTGPGTSPLPIGLRGLRDDRMVLRCEGVLYLQETGEAVDAPSGTPPLPFAEFPLTRTTWGAWKQEHPESTFSRVGDRDPD